jgi:hypothetical protein
MRTTIRIPLLLVTAALAAGCASTPKPPPPAPEPITPADLVASIADVAAGRNPALAETGLVLQKIEFHLSVGRQTRAGGKIEVLLLDAEAARSADTAFLQELTLEIPKTGRRSAAPAPLVPGVVEFVDAAMNTARDLARAAQSAGLPQKLTGVELTAKITRSRTLGGGITATIPAWVKPSIGVDVGTKREEENVVRMIFAAP